MVQILWSVIKENKNNNRSSEKEEKDVNIIEEFKLEEINSESIMNGNIN